MIEHLQLWSANILAPLRQEAQGYAAAFEYRHVKTLLNARFNPARAMGAGILGIANVEELKDDSWHPADHGTQMLTVAVTEGDSVTDIVAFDPADPTRWLLRTGNAWALGLDAIEAAQSSWEGDVPLEVHATPFDWLCSGLTGCCIINWTNEARAIMRSLPSIRVHNARYAQALRLELARPPRIPEITYPGERRRAA